MPGSCRGWQTLADGRISSEEMKGTPALLHACRLRPRCANHQLPRWGTSDRFGAISPRLGMSQKGRKRPRANGCSQPQAGAPDRVVRASIGDPAGREFCRRVEEFVQCRCRDQPFSRSFCGNMARRASSSISVLNACRSFSAAGRCTAGRSFTASRSRSRGAVVRRRPRPAQTPAPAFHKTRIDFCRGVGVQCASREAEPRSVPVRQRGSSSDDGDGPSRLREERLRRLAGAGWSGAGKPGCQHPGPRFGLAW
jgi:hypothetical protein